MNRQIKTAFFIIAIVAVSYLYFATAEAGETTLSWTLPTASESCAPVSTVPEIQATQVWQLVGTGGPTDTELTLTGLLPGEYTYVASVVAVPNDEYPDGAVSRFSAVSTKTIGPLTVADDKAYTVVKSGGGFVAFIIGTVPVGTVCDENNMVKGEFNFAPFIGYVVPISSVTITGDVEPSAVVAVCQ